MHRAGRGRVCDQATMLICIVPLSSTQKNTFYTEPIPSRPIILCVVPSLSTQEFGGEEGGHTVPLSRPCSPDEVEAIRQSNQVGHETGEAAVG